MTTKGGFHPGDPAPPISDAATHHGGLRRPEAAVGLQQHVAHEAADAEGPQRRRLVRVQGQINGEVGAAGADEALQIAAAATQQDLQVRLDVPRQLRRRAVEQPATSAMKTVTDAP